MTRARTDRNHAEIMRALRAAGVSVTDLSAVGRGCPDLLCGYAYRTTLLEVKDGDKPPSARKLTKDQVDWHANWNGFPVRIVTNVDEAMRACWVRS